MTSSMSQTTADTLDSSLLEIQGSIEQAESMLKQLETQGQGDSPTAEKIRNLLDQMRAQRKKLFDSLTTVENVNSRMTFMEEIAQKSANGGLISANFPQSSSSKKKFIPPRPPSDDEDEKTSPILEQSCQILDKPQKSELELPPLSDLGSSDLFSIMDSIMSTKGPGSSKSAKWKLDQLSTLESQLSKLKATITAAKSQATKELETETQTKLDLENNLSFVQLKHQTSNLKIVQETQHDRLKDIVSILNNHADRMCNIEDSIAEMRHELKSDIEERKKVEKDLELIMKRERDGQKLTLNSMAEKLLEKLLKTHESRPHFILELFELACGLDSDKKRGNFLKTAKNVMICEKMEEIDGLKKKLEDVKSSVVPAIENGGHDQVQDEENRVSVGVSLAIPNGDFNVDSDTHSDRNIVSPLQNFDETSQTAESDIIPSDTCEQQVLLQEDALQNDMVSQLLSAANAKIDISSLNEEVNKMVTDLLPILASQYKDKILTDDIIAEAKVTIGNHIITECAKIEHLKKTEDREGIEDVFNDHSKIYLLSNLESCLKNYKGQNISSESVNILSDIGTNIYRSILNAKINKSKK